MKKRDKAIQLRVTAKDIAAWRAAAEADGRSLSDWIRRVCTRSLEGSDVVRS